MIPTLITVDKFLETRSKGKTFQAIIRLMNLASKTIHVLWDGAEVEIPVEEVRMCDRVAVRPGLTVSGAWRKTQRLLGSPHPAGPVSAVPEVP